MKKILLGLPILALLSSCGMGDSSSSGNPLDKPSFNRNAAPLVEADTVSPYLAGEFLTVTPPQIMVYPNNPTSGNGGQGTWQKQGTSLKFISASGAYYKVEMPDGKIGYAYGQDLSKPEQNPAPQENSDPMSPAPISPAPIDTNLPLPEPAEN